VVGARQKRGFLAGPVQRLESADLARQFHQRDRNDPGVQLPESCCGDYFFRIGGPIGDAMFGNAYVYRFEVSEVPLPPALLLFATALGGMVVFGCRRRNAPA
jgi:hypothetical protein